LTRAAGRRNHITAMTRDEEAKIVRLYDSRTIERTIRKGLVTRKDYEKYLKALPDVAEKAAPADTSDLLDDDDDDLEDDDEVETEGGEPPAA
jgi:hypothetical protein